MLVFRPDQIPILALNTELRSSFPSGNVPWRRICGLFIAALALRLPNPATAKPSIFNINDSLWLSKQATLQFCWLFACTDKDFIGLGFFVHDEAKDL